MMPRTPGSSEKGEALIRPLANPVYGAPVSVPAALPSSAAITVTQPYLPPLAEFIPYLEKIWATRWLTNDGPFHEQLEAALCEYLGVEHISLFANGTLALIAALRVLGVGGEVITTPYSFVATAHSLLWCGIEPVFVDIDPNSLNLDPDKIAAAITPRTTAIMPVHCYGRPCDVDRIAMIAAAHGLKVIYDAAHAFGVRYSCGSLLNHGDLSVLSFHATKVFTTFEGGAIVSHDQETKEQIDRLKNFGIVDEVTVAAAGINAKMSEVGAAFGLVQLKHIDEIFARRRAIDARYRAALAGVRGIYYPPDANQSGSNCSYFPVLVKPDYPLGRDRLYRKLKDHSIYARRYFYPLIPSFPMYSGLPSAAICRLPVAAQVAEEVLCLPIYPTLREAEQDRIVALIEEA
jgi:dTDP-4-amino-4,6-dideoxygalactose transaminase